METRILTFVLMKPRIFTKELRYSDHLISNTDLKLSITIFKYFNENSNEGVYSVKPCVSFHLFLFHFDVCSGKAK